MPLIKLPLWLSDVDSQSVCKLPCPADGLCPALRPLIIPRGPSRREICCRQPEPSTSGATGPAWTAALGHVAAATRHKELRACTGQSSVLAHGEGEALPSAWASSGQCLLCRTPWCLPWRGLGTGSCSLQVSTPRAVSSDLFLSPRHRQHRDALLPELGGCPSVPAAEGGWWSESTRSDSSAQNPDGSRLSFQQLPGWRGCSLRCPARGACRGSYWRQRRRFGLSFERHLPRALCGLCSSPLSAASRVHQRADVHRQRLGNAATLGSASSRTNPRPQRRSRTRLRGVSGTARPGWLRAGAVGQQHQHRQQLLASPRLRGRAAAARSLRARRLKKAKTHLSELAALSKS